MTDEQIKKIKDALKIYYQGKITSDLLFEILDVCFAYLPDKYKDKDYIPQYDFMNDMNMSNNVYTVLASQIYGVAYYRFYVFEPNLNRIMYKLSNNNKYTITDEVLSEYPLIDLMFYDECNTNSLTYYPPIFACHVLINYLANKLQPTLKSSDYRTYLRNYFGETVLSMITTARSIILCLDTNYNDRTDAFALLRSLLETYVDFKIVTSDYKFINVYHCNRLLYPRHDDMYGLELFKIVKKSYPNVQIEDMYDNHGWLKIISGEDKIFYFKDMVNLAGFNSSDKSKINSYYKLLNLYVHGSIKNYDSQESDLYDVLDILMFLLDKISQDVKNEPHNEIDFMYENVDLCKYLQDEMSNLHKDIRKRNKMLSDIRSGKPYIKYDAPNGTVIDLGSDDKHKTKECMIFCIVFFFFANRLIYIY